MAANEDHEPDGAGTTLGWKVFAGLCSVLAATAARKAVRVGWRTATGKQPPEKPEALVTSWVEVAGWTALSGTAIALARLVATRRAAAIWVRSTGSLPPGVPTTSTVAN